MSRWQRFAGGVVVTWAGLALTLAAGLWLTPFYLQRLGGERYGLWLVGMQVLAWLMLLDLGVVALVPRETAYAVGRGDPPRAIAEALASTWRLVWWQALVVLLAGLATAAWLPERWAPLSAPLAAVAVVFAATFPFRVFQAALNGLQDLAFLGGVQIAAWAAGTLLTVALVASGGGLGALAAGWAVTQIASALAWTARLRLRFPDAFPGLSIVSGGRVPLRRLRSGAWVSAAQIAQVLTNGSELIVIGALLGAEPVVVYACTAKLVAVLTNLPQVLTQAAAPALSELRAGPARARLPVVSAALTEGMLAASGLTATVALAATASFVDWWVGPAYFGGTALTLLLVLTMVLRHWNTTAVYALFCFGRERRTAVTTLLDGAVATGGAALLVPVAGLAGAPIAAIAAVVLVSLPANLAALARELDVPARRLVVERAGWAIRFGLAAVAAAAAGAWLRQPSAAAVVALAVTAGAVYAILAIPRLLHSPAGAYVAPWFERLRSWSARPATGG